MDVDLLEVHGLRVDVATGEPIVSDIDLRLERGQTLALVGESGSGKTAAALALIGFARLGTRITSGQVLLDGVDLLKLSPVELRRARGDRIAFVPQNPAAALNPSLRIEDQLLDTLRAHSGNRTSDSAEIDALLDRVSLSGKNQFRRRYPHELSGGQQQRVLIAMALACRPDIIVLDEPTTALDVTTQAHVLELIKDLRTTTGMSLIYVTHDLAVVSDIADRVMVMYGGVLVEVGDNIDVLTRPRHPYTRQLLSALPRLDGERRTLVGIPGSAPGPGEYGSGCTFAGRCQHRQERCDEPQQVSQVGVGHVVRCVRWRELASDRSQVLSESHTQELVVGSSLLNVRALTAVYRQRGTRVVALDCVSLNLARRECVAVVGESGSGKSTLARCIAGLHRLWEGEIEFDGNELAVHAPSRPLEARRRIQIVFQNPDRSLNPQHTIESILARPFHQLLGVSSREARSNASELLDRVRLPKRYALRYPAELSGGERQRVAIARALAPNPDVVICDEVTSALDVSVQASLLELLNELRRDLALSLLFISHDLAVVRAIADRVVVLQHGKVCEDREAADLFATPRHPYTQSLFAAAPRLSPPALEMVDT